MVGWISGSEELDLGRWRESIGIRFSANPQASILLGLVERGKQIHCRKSRLDGLNSESAGRLLAKRTCESVN